MSSKSPGRVAPRKNLHDGRSLWHDSTRRTVRTRTLRQSETCEIAVIGGGISGALTALSLVEAGHEVMVLDRRPPGEGSTVASTAMIQFEIDTPLTEQVYQSRRFLFPCHLTSLINRTLNGCYTNLSHTRMPVLSCAAQPTSSASDDPFERLAMRALTYFS